MAVKQLGNETTTVYADGAEFVMERVFHAPRELVWKALTEAERIPQWWGPRDTSMTVAEMDVRPGGKWRWIHTSEGQDYPFTGEYREVVPPSRLVYTELLDVEPFNSGGPAVVTVTLEPVDGKTRLTSRSRFPSAEALEGALATGMVGGAIESWDRLAEEIARG